MDKLSNRMELGQNPMTVHFRPLLRPVGSWHLIFSGCWLFAGLIGCNPHCISLFLSRMLKCWNFIRAEGAQVRTENWLAQGHSANDVLSRGTAGCPRTDPLQAPEDLHSSDDYSEAQGGPCTAPSWPKKGWNPGASPSQGQSVQKSILASDLSLENGEGASTPWRVWDERSWD